MHPLLVEWSRLGAYLAAWALLGLLLAALLVLAAPFGWTEAIFFAVPLAVLFGFMGLASFWVCQAAPLPRGVVRASGMQLLAGVASGSMWLAAGYGYAIALERAGVFPGLVAKQAEAAPLLLGLGVALYLLAAALHYVIVAFEASREAELRALRAQIHPHFLFNSLNSINALIATKPEEARQLSVRLADFLRRSLTVGSREAIPLAEELDLAEQLLSIERVRFGDRLSHVVVADDAARACPVPPLVLQPLVENAVTHGIAQMLDGGEVHIEAERRGEELRIAIVNPRDIESPGRKGTGIGLQNVKRRLFALHGNAAEVRVVPGDSSFRVELRLPAGR